VANTLRLLEAFGDKESVEALKKDFRENFMKVWKDTETEYCNEHKRPPVMTPELATEIMGYLERCHTPFHIEALKQMVLVQWQIPNSYDDLDREAGKLMTKALT
jgi:hypothetical protein